MASLSWLHFKFQVNCSFFFQDPSLIQFSDSVHPLHFPLINALLCHWICKSLFLALHTQTTLNVCYHTHAQHFNNFNILLKNSFNRLSVEEWLDYSNLIRGNKVLWWPRYQWSWILASKMWWILITKQSTIMTYNNSY